MKKSKIVSILAMVLFLGVIMFPHIVSAQTNNPNPVYIYADGSIEGTTSISREDNLYTLTANITGSFIIEKDNVILDGDGFWLQADSGADDTAFTIDGKSNVTIRNLAVTTSGTGMALNQVSACSIVNVTIQAERAGIRARNVTYSTVANSHIDAKIEYGLSLAFSPNNVVANDTIITQMVDAINCGYSSNNTITGNTLTYETSQFPIATGIEFDGSTNCTIYQNHIKGFPMTGINLQGYSHNNTIEANDVMNCDNGIRISSSNQNVLAENYVGNCNGSGIRLDSSQGNLLRGNQLNNNSQNLAVSSYTAAGWINDVDASNWANLKPVIYWVNVSDKMVPSFTGCIILVNCTDITVTNQNFTGKGDAVLMVYTQKSSISNNYASENSTIHLYGSSENNIKENQFVNNDKGLFLESSCFNNIISSNNFTGNGFGMYLSSSSSNTLIENNFEDNQNAIYFSSASSNNIYLNNFVNNTLQVYDSGMNNPYAVVVPAVSSPRPADASAQMLFQVSVEPANFIGPLPLSINNWDNGVKGNYWSDYNGTDANGDGIGDAAYYLYGNNQDNYPLMSSSDGGLHLPNYSLSPSPNSSSIPTSSPSPSVPEFPARVLLPLLMVAVSFLLVFRGRSRH